MGTEGVFLKASAHPRAFGNFVRVYARYVRDEDASRLSAVSCNRWLG
jgi:N-acyl-D-amino-acid deacylase